MELAQSDIEILEQLRQACQESQRRIFLASEHVRNRGLKLVLKSYVQQRAQFADELELMIYRATSDDPSDSAPTPSLARGWVGIQTTMIVRREDRQHHILQELYNEEEEQLLDRYTEALEQPLDAAVMALLSRQRQAIEAVQQRLQVLATEQTDQRFVVRLYNQPDQAERVVEQLINQGFDARDVDVVEIEDVDLYLAQAPELRRSLRETVLTSALLGGGVGLVLGVLLALGHQIYFPEVGGILTDTRLGVTIELLAAGVFIGMLFGAIAGLFIGRDAAEDDAYLFAESIQHGDRLVTVFTDISREPQAEQILGLQHEFEVKPNTPHVPAHLSES